jgi:hypothetical protein
MSISIMNAESEAARALLDMKSVVFLAPPVREESPEFSYKKKRKVATPAAIESKIVPRGSGPTQSKGKKKLKCPRSSQKKL